MSTRCRSHVVKQMLPAAADEAMLEWHLQDDSPWIQDRVYLRRVVLWLLVEHDAEADPSPDGTLHEWTQYTVEPWTYENYRYWFDWDNDDFTCDLDDRDERRAFGSMSEMQNRKAEVVAELGLEEYEPKGPA